MQKGIVYRSTGSWYDIKLNNGAFIKARIKGKFRNLSIRTTNPVAVGDEVLVDINDLGEGVIKEISPRKNYIIRKSVNLSKEAHIIASNVDLAVLLVTVVSPFTAPGFIDRFTVTAEAYNVPLLIVFNKIDLYDEKAMAILSEYEQSYKKANYSTLNTSLVNQTGINDFKQIIEGKTVLLSGNSGAGKSTLINELKPDLKLKTGAISKSHQTGKHTTTFAEMFDLSLTTQIIDTPGIKGFGLVDFEKEELARYFPEMLELLGDCKFHNCRHLNEPGCKVLEKLKEGSFSSTRHNSYVTMYNEDEDVNYRQNIHL